jgi:hypothetical protein
MNASVNKLTVKKNCNKHENGEDCHNVERDLKKPDRISKSHSSPLKTRKTSGEKKCRFSILLNEINGVNLTKLCSSLFSDFCS